MTEEKGILQDIQQHLDQIESEHNVRILYAVESGSRAWGFPSLDSDYDVRFIFCHPASKYWSIFSVNDVIGLPVNEVLDISGWDLKKSLGLAYKSNAALMEWIKSPIVYRGSDVFADGMEDLFLHCFQPRAAAHHYVGLASNAWKSICDLEEVKLKKYFYVLRSLLAWKWVVTHQSPPPITWSELCTHCSPNKAFDDLTAALIAEKAVGTESSTTKHHAILDQFITETLEQSHAVAATLPKMETDRARMVDFFRSTLKLFAADDN